MRGEESVRVPIDLKVSKKCHCQAKWREICCTKLFDEKNYTLPQLQAKNMRHFLQQIYASYPLWTADIWVQKVDPLFITKQIITNVLHPFFAKT